MEKLKQTELIEMFWHNQIFLKVDDEYDFDLTEMDFFLNKFF